MVLKPLADPGRGLNWDANEHAYRHQLINDFPGKFRTKKSLIPGLQRGRVQTNATLERLPCRNFSFVSTHGVHSN